MTDDLDALESELWASDAASALTNRAARAITALRAQLAEAKAEKEKLGRELNLSRYGQPDFSWQVHKEALAEANARADRADAERAAQIEADAGIAECRWVEWKNQGQDCAVECDVSACHDIGKAIRAQPHDRTALDRMLAEARAQALRDAADWHDREAAGAMNSLHCGSENGEYRAANRLHDFHKASAAAIPALLDKEGG